MEEINFKILSTRLNKNDFHFTNVEVINGVWWKNVVSDNEIKDLYEHASMTILPLKDTLQPSGKALVSHEYGTNAYRDQRFMGFEKFKE